MLGDYARVNTTVIVSTAGVVLAAAALTTWWRRRRERTRIPSRWRRVGELVELSMYPLKSGAALPLKEADCTEFGLQTTNAENVKLRDRFFIVINDGGIMKTARQNPKLFFINVSTGDGDTVVFKAPDMKDLIVHIPTGSPKRRNIFMMWKEEQGESIDCGDEAADWIHSFLGLKDTDKVRLGYYQMEHIPRRDCYNKPYQAFRKHYNRLMRFDMGAYSDFASYLLINEASVKDLNKRIPTSKNVAPSWFRPNFVVRGPEPLVEDNWNYIKIGDSAIFQNFKPCLRCIMTTMDPQTATKDPDMQPLRTLRRYRLLADKKKQALENELAPAMGCYVGVRQVGTVRMGDPVYVEE